jgi:salicylate 5-hydroxylase small subunit
MSPEQRFAIEDLYSEYARRLDDGPLEAWPELFTDACLYRVVPRENHDAGLPLAIMHCESRAMLRDRVRAVQETIMHESRDLRHHITNVVPEAEPDGAYRVRANFSVVEVLQDELPRILSVGRYLDRVVAEADGSLRFVEKIVVFDSVMVPNTIVYPL